MPFFVGLIALLLWPLGKATLALRLAKAYWMFWTVLIGVYYMGALYRMVNSLLAILSFIVFSIWPAAGLAIYGWFFAWF